MLVIQKNAHYPFIRDGSSKKETVLKHFILAESYHYTRLENDLCGTRMTVELSVPFVCRQNDFHKEFDISGHAFIR